MNKLLNRQYIKGIAMICGCSLILSSCSDWNDTESLKINSPSLETQNPELYEAYLNSLRDFKSSKHKVVITKFDNKEANPEGQAEHLVSLPDSVDYVILNNADNLNPIIVEEMEAIHSDKGTKVLFTIDFSVIKDEYDKMIKEQEKSETESEETENPETDNFLDFCKTKTDYSLSLYDKYKYDGINVAFTGILPASLSEEEKIIEGARQEFFFGLIQEWKANHKDAVIMFEGNPENIISGKQLLNEALYIIIPAIDAVCFEDFILPINRAMVKDVPTDRFILGTTVPFIEDEKYEIGYLVYDDGDAKMTAIKGAAIEVEKYSKEFVKAGICIDKANSDYYNSTFDYKTIREAINIMNPAPLY